MGDEDTLGLPIDRAAGVSLRAPHLYRELHRTRAPLVGSQLWVGANDHGHVAWQRSHSLTFQNLPKQRDGLGASLTFGYGVVQFMFHGSEEHGLQLRNEPFLALRPIWPTREAFGWPPGLRVRPHALTALPLIINENCRFIPLGA